MINRTSLENKYHRYKTDDDRKEFRKEKNFTNKLLKIEKIKNCQTPFSDKQHHQQHKIKIISKDANVAESFNVFF